MNISHSVSGSTAVIAARSRLVLAAALVLAPLTVCSASGKGSAVAEASASANPADPVPLKRIDVFPPDVQLAGTRQRVQFVVTGHDIEGGVRDLTAEADFTSSDPSVVKVHSAVGVPAGNGNARIRVRAGGHQTTVDARVFNQTVPQRVSFEYDMLAAVSKQGCNSGACHGSPAGKGGFRLSLRAFDPQLDRLTLIREGVGRRTNPLEPAESLLLLKPLSEVSHGGGRRLETTDPAYDVMREWIAQGCREDAAGQPRLVELEVYPASGRLLKRPAFSQQLSVRARFSDGSSRDVTDLAVFSSSDEDVASVTAEGRVVAKKRGEAAILVRYLEFIESTSLTFVEDVEGFAWRDPPKENYIDDLVDAKLRQLKFAPSPRCDDATFLRRVYLDVIGILPTVAEIRSFLADESPEKRSRLIDDLLERPEFARFWALKWGDLLRLTSDRIGGDGVHKYHRWIRRAVDSNMSYDEFARRLLTARGSTHANPPANFYRTAADTNECVETVSQVFLGARLQCAKCHNHPFERWTQDNYYGMAAFFNRVRRGDTAKPDEKLVWVAREGEVTQPRTGEQMKPWLPGRGDVQPSGSDDRRELFVRWLTGPDNPYFARIEVNRIWSYLMGRGIVDPPDDFRDSNPPSNPELLDALADDFVRSGFDRKHIIRTILNSRTYQASTETTRFNESDSQYFSHREPRMLTAEQLLDAITAVSGVAESFGSLPPGTKATHLPAPDLVKHQFLEDFGQPKRKTACQCERSAESNLGMAIQFYNGPLLHRKLTDPDNRFRTLAAAGGSDEAIVTELHLAAYGRPPSEAELESHLGYLKSKQTERGDRSPEEARDEALEDICWAILTSNEFLLQH